MREKLVMDIFKIYLWFPAYLIGLPVYNSQDSCPRGYTRHPKYDNKCYALTTGPASERDTAIAECEESGGSLALIYNQNIHEFVVGLIGINSNVENIFIGMNDEDSDGDYVWEDDEAVRWAKWASNEPTESNNNGRNCVVYKKPDGVNWLLYPLGCNSLSHAVCEYTITDDSAKTVALVDGTDVSGKLELYYENRWGSVCDEGRSLFAMQYVCMQLNLTEGGFLSTSVIHRGTSTSWKIIWTCGDDIACRSKLLRGEDLWTLEEKYCDKREEIKMFCEGTEETSTPNLGIFTASVSTSSEVLDETSDVSSNEETAVQITTENSIEISTDRYTSQVTSSISNNIHTTGTNLQTAKCSTVSAITTIPSASNVQSNTSIHSTACMCKCTDYFRVMSTSAGTGTGTDRIVPDVPYKKKDTAKFSTATRYDGRPSAIAIGVLGIAILSMTFGFIILLDLTTIKKEFVRLKSNVADFFQQDQPRN